MNERVAKLRKQSVEAVNKISPERALLVTEFYKSREAFGISAPLARALCLKHILEHKLICINPGELIVGERGPAPKSVPTYPEICLHSLEDLDILDSREKVSFKVDEETKIVYRDVIIPFWKGKSHRDRIMNSLPREWKDSYAAGIFTEFMEQRAPGHTVAGNNIYKKGLLDFKKDIDYAISNLDFYNDKEAYSKKEQLTAMSVACDAVISFALRHSVILEKLAAAEIDEIRKKELFYIADVCRKVPANAPQTFHEALQHYWFIHIAVITEVNPWDSFNPGRLDINLLPFYEKEISEGTLTQEKARELLQCFWIKFNNHPAPPKVGVTAKESNTYTDFTLINVGGLFPDGSDAVNDLSYLILEVIEEMRLLQPGTMAQLSKKNPESFILHVLKIIKTGFGQPSVFNTDAIIQEMLRQGKDIKDAREGGASGCVETGAFGREAYILTGYFNLPKILEITLNRGFDKRTQKQIAPDTGRIESFDSLMSSYKKQIEYFADVKIKGSNIIESLFAEYIPVPFLSVIIEDCISNGKDYNCGGARYNTNYIQGVGMGTVTDSLSALKYHVYDNGKLSLNEFLDILEKDFDGNDSLLSELIYNTPKYGNDDDYADENAVRVFDYFYDSVNGKPSPRGAVYRINLLPTTCHVYFGSVLGATPDGRRKGTPVSEGISPAQGADIKGPTAVINSCAKLDHLRTGGTLLNQKFSPQFLADEEGLKKTAGLIRSYFRMDGHHIQFNVVNAGTLRDAVKHPEKYRDLIVRVAGYSDYFNDLTPELQQEIIRRTEHGST